jgi:hypothetical protein
VSFSPDAGFTSDSTLARVVARADFAVNDPSGLFRIT